MKTLRERVRWTRRRTCLAQTHLAEKIGVTRGAVANWETGRAEPRRKHMARLAILAHVDYDWLTTGRGEANQSDDKNNLTLAHLEFATESDERELLSVYKACSFVNRCRILDLARALHDKRQSPRPPIYPLDGLMDGESSHPRPRRGRMDAFEET